MWPTVAEHVPPRGIGKASGGTQALAGVALSADAGAVLALLGSHGASNTTLVRILTTAPAPDAGPVRPAGVDVLRDAAAVRSVIGLPRRSAAIDSLANGLVDEARSVVALVRTNRTDHHRVTSKSGDTSETSDRR